MIIGDPERTPLPDGTIINAELTVTSYFDSDGHLKYGVHIGGDPNLAQAMGLLELAKISIYTTYMSSEPFPPDDKEEEDDER